MGQMTPSPLLGFLWKDDYFKPGTLKDFTGSEWGGVSLGETTRDAFKRRYKTKGGKFVRAEALIVNPVSGSPWDIQALLDGSKGSSLITGFYLTYREGGTRLSRIEVGSEPAEMWYPKDRFSDWYVAAYPGKGIALMVVRENDDRVPYALLTTRARLERMLDTMEKDKTLVRSLAQQFDRLDRTVEIGTVTVSLTKKDLRLRNEDLAMSTLRLRTPREISSDIIRYTDRGLGSVSIDVSITFRDDKNDNEVSVSAQLTGSNERGKISISSTGKASLDRSESRAYRDLDYALENAYRDAMDSLRKQTDRKVNEQRPPSATQDRTDAFVRLFEDPTK